MKTLPEFHLKRISLSASVLLIIVLLVTGCSGNSGSSNSSTPTASSSVATTSTATPGSTPQVKLGTQPCPDAVKAPSYWDPIVGTQSGVSQVGRVTCANLIGQPSLQALILVGYQGTGMVVDAYVYNNITNPRPTQIFKLQSLYKGDALISAYNTVITAEVDHESSINKGQPNARLTIDLYREFKWSDGAGTLVPVTFPGIYPDLTRYQAENDQAQVNQGQTPWKLNAAQVANHMAADPHLLNWPSNASTTVVSGGGSSDS